MLPLSPPSSSINSDRQGGGQKKKKRKALVWRDKSNVDIPIVRENDRSVTILVSFQSALSTLSFPFLFFFLLFFSFCSDPTVDTFNSRPSSAREGSSLAETRHDGRPTFAAESCDISSPREVICTVEKVLFLRSNRASRSLFHHGREVVRMLGL